MSGDSTRKPTSGPLPPLNAPNDEIRLLEAEAQSLKARLDDVTAKLLKAIAGKVPRPHPTALEGNAPTFQPQRVLIVEDESEAREILKSLVLRLGHVVHAAANGHDALAHLEEFRPEVALIDLGLPGLDGIAIARRSAPRLAPPLRCSSHTRAMQVLRPERPLPMQGSSTTC